MMSENERRRESRRGYHVLLNSRPYGTSEVVCATLEEAARTLGWLATQAAQAQRIDRVQRFFCLQPPQTEEEAGAKGPVSALEQEDALVICLSAQTLQWIAGEGLTSRPLLVLEALGDGKDGPFLCWEACPRPLATLDGSIRHTLNRYLEMRKSCPPEAQDEDPVMRAWQRQGSDEVVTVQTLVPIEAQEAQG